MTKFLHDYEKVPISHHCMGNVKTWHLNNEKLPIDCFEVSTTGEILLTDSKSFSFVVRFCPICGKESAYHAALKEQETVRMVEHAILD